jgi:hypothetical protein
MRSRLTAGERPCTKPKCICDRRHICEAECRVSRQKRLILKLERLGQMAARPDAPDLLTAMLAGWDASWAHRRALAPRED